MLYLLMIELPKILEKMRDIPILGAFTAFPAENLRNKYNILKLGAQQLREGFETGNKALQKAGAQRLKTTNINGCYTYCCCIYL
jgi:hypothetical protein